jgi:two-component system cell cycle response regulator
LTCYIWQTPLEGHLFSFREIRFMERILVVEDDSFFREVFSDLLREEGYEVDVATCGHEALEMIESQDYHVVVTDLVMHDVSGLEILSRVKQRDPAIEVIMVTGHANMETAIYALKNGARDYLVKPINHVELKHSVALCVEQRRLLDENQELKGLVNLFQVSQTIANCLDLERLYTLVLDSLAKEVGVTRGLGYFDSDNKLTLLEIKELDEGMGQQLGAAIMANFNWDEDEGGSYVLLNNFLPPDADFGDADIRESMIFFIRSKGALIGVVVLFNEPGQNFPANVNYRNLNFLLDQSTLAFDNAVRYTSARDLLYVDELTNLFNYRYLDVALEREIKRSERYGSSLALIFLDIDTFKGVNDTYGHLVGSRVLREMGALLKKSVREVDTVIRYGGDEYTIILVETGAAGAAIVAERIRHSIEEQPFHNGVRLTACLGYACYPHDTKSKIELLELADQAMYRGKVSGRNMVYSLAGEKSGEGAETTGGGTETAGDGRQGRGE